MLLTCARSILKNRIAVTESTKHQLSLDLVTILLESTVFIDSSLDSISSFKFILFWGLFSRNFPIKALTCSRSALEVVFISPNGRASSKTHHIRERMYSIESTYIGKRLNWKLVVSINLPFNFSLLWWYIS